MYERQQVEPKYLPPTTIANYVHTWIETAIPMYGEIIAYIVQFNRRTGMVSMFMYQGPQYRQAQYMEVHHSDMIGIRPYYGPIPPQPNRPPHPGGPPPHHGGGFWPWVFHQTFG